MGMEALTISQIAERAGVRPSTIRYYESIELLPAPRRVSGQRRYEAAILDRLAFIRVAQRLGFTLVEIRALFHDRGAQEPLAERWQELARRKLADIDTLIGQARDIRRSLVRGMRCECPDLLNCIDCVLANCYGRGGAS